MHKNKTYFLSNQNVNAMIDHKMNRDAMQEAPVDLCYWAKFVVL